MIHEEFPDAEITGIDISGAMLEKASARPELEGVRFLVQDLRDAWPAGHYDVIVSSLCLHHIPKEDRVVVAQRAVRQLNPGGRFICGDVFRAGTAWEEEIQREIWCRGMRRGGASEDVIRGLIAQREKHMPTFTTVSWFRDMLVESGFSRSIVPFTSGFIGLVVGFTGESGERRIMTESAGK
jgi:SAM-dependent methyltransferase